MSAEVDAAWGDLQRARTAWLNAQERYLRAWDQHLRDVKATEAPPEQPEPVTPEPNPHVDALRAELTKEIA